MILVRCKVIAESYAPFPRSSHSICVDDQRNVLTRTVFRSARKSMSTYKDKIAAHLTQLRRGDISEYFFDCIIITLVPLILLLFNQTWIYAKYSNVDEWMYVGYGYYYWDPFFYATNYKISRLPWVLTEALVRGSFPPLISSWILGFGVLAFGNIILYFALRMPFGRLPALFASIFIAGVTFMHANGGADYHNTLAGAFYCLSMFFCARCARQQFVPRDLIFFGASIALTIHTNIVFINLLPILIGQYWGSYRIHHRTSPPLVSAAIMAAFGALVVTILLGLINFSFGRPFPFFMEQFKLVSSFIADSSRQKPFWLPWSSYWFLAVSYMGFLFAGTLLSIAVVFLAAPSRSISPRLAYASLFCAAYLCAASIWMTWQTIGQTALQPDYFAFPLGFPLAGALAAGIAASIETEVRPRLLTIAAVCFAAAMIAGIRNADHIQNFLGTVSWPRAVRVAISFSVAFSIILLARRFIALAPVAAVALAIANGLSVDDTSAYAASTCTISRDAYELMLDVGKTLRETHAPVTRIFVFADKGEEVKIGADCRGREFPLGWIQSAVWATGFEEVAPSWSYETLDTVEPKRWKEIVTTQGLVAFLTYNPARISVLRAKIVAAGGKPGEARLFTFHEGELEVTLYVLPFA
ncbi:MAG: hypothetical protein JOY67_10495 [Hyphomicrobiales bacterium]|nr:hypothetical protein [Hyphomicrobiales bacterium]